MILIQPTLGGCERRTSHGHSDSAGTPLDSIRRDTTAFAQSLGVQQTVSGALGREKHGVLLCGDTNGQRICTGEGRSARPGPLILQNPHGTHVGEMLSQWYKTTGAPSTKMFRYGL